MKPSLGNYIRELRQQKCLTLRQLGEKVGINFTYLSKIENDALMEQHSVSVDNLRRLAKELNGDFDQLQLLAKKVPEQVVKDATTKESAMQFFLTVSRKGLTEEEWKSLLKYLDSEI